MIRSGTIQENRKLSKLAASKTRTFRRITLVAECIRRTGPTRWLQCVCLHARKQNPTVPPRWGSWFLNPQLTCVRVESERVHNAHHGLGVLCESSACCVVLGPASEDISRGALAQAVANADLGQVVVFRHNTCRLVGRLGPATLTKGANAPIGNAALSWVALYSVLAVEVALPPLSPSM